MKLAHCCAQLAQHGEAIRVLVASVSEQEARWKPAAEAWSVLEVINQWPTMCCTCASLWPRNGRLPGK